MLRLKIHEDEYKTRSGPEKKLNTHLKSIRVQDAQGKQVTIP